MIFLFSRSIVVAFLNVLTWKDDKWYLFYIIVLKDGCEVPITLFHKKNIKLTGQLPLLAHVYGKYTYCISLIFYIIIWSCHKSS